MLTRWAGIAGLTAVAFVIGFGFARHARELPVTFETRPETFAYGPVGRAVRQSFVSPAPYLSAVSIDLRVAEVEPEGYPVNLRLRSERDEVLAEQRLLLKESLRPQSHAIRFAPRSESKGRRFFLEVQPAEGASGRLTVPIFIGPGSEVGEFVDQDGLWHPNWASHYRLFQTVRPATFFMALARSDPLTAAGYVSAFLLLGLAAGILLAGAAARLPLVSPPLLWQTAGLACGLGGAWAFYALVPAR